MAERIWHHLSYGNAALADENGKILGEISVGYRRTRAFSGGELLGEYVDIEPAKRAVERAVALSSTPERTKADER